jgi:hypothetical protein
MNQVSNFESVGVLTKELEPKNKKPLQSFKMFSVCVCVQIRQTYHVRQIMSKYESVIFETSS